MSDEAPKTCDACVKWLPISPPSKANHTAGHGVCRRIGSSTVAVAVSEESAMVLGTGSFLTGPKFACPLFVSKEVHFDPLDNLDKP